jgi:uncharacterized repeat protein (TIGR01451 family)
MCGARHVRHLSLALVAFAVVVTILWSLAPGAFPEGAATEAQGFAILSGRVYAGIAPLEPPSSVPLEGVRVDLHCSNEPYPDLGAIIDTTVTDATGWYGLDVTVRQCLYYYIRETNLPGYVSDDATSVDGTVMDPDLIQYTPSLFDKTLTGNKFWDRLPATPPAPTADLQLTKEVVVPASGPVGPGDKVQFNILLQQNGPSVAANVVVTDTLSDGLTFDAAVSGCSLAGHEPDVVRCNLGDLATSSLGTVIWLQAVVDRDACGPLVNTATVTGDTPDPDLTNNAANATIGAAVCPELPVIVMKTLVDPAGGVADVGDLVTFQIEATNTGATPVTVDVRDDFLDAEFEFVSATSMPIAAVKPDEAFPDTGFDVVSAAPVSLANLSDGIHHLLVWEDVTILAGETVSSTVSLKPKVPGAQIVTCANCVPAGLPGTVALPGLPSCANLGVLALQGKHASIYKRFTMPGNHVAQLGDWISFETEWRNIGTETASKVRLYDHVTPTSVSSFLPLQFGWNWAFGTADWAKVTAAFKTQDTASPAVNIAEWTATWADGTATAQTASDYVYVVDGPIAKDVFLTKTLMDPLAGAVVSDTITFQVAITNASGGDLPAVALSDQFDQQCLSFQEASIPPDSVTAGAATWSDVGPLAQGASRTIDVLFHAEAVCPAAFNCATAEFQQPGGQTVLAAGCDQVSIQGGKPELVVRKIRTSPGSAVVGDTVVWEIEVGNVGSAPLSVVPLHDGYQVAHFDFLTATLAPTTDLVHGRLDWSNLGPLFPGETHTVTVRLIAVAAGLGATNCAESHYAVGSTNFVPSSCATVDVLSEPPSIQVEKKRVVPNPGTATAVGDTVTFEVSVSNTGQVPLSDVLIQDTYDPDCMSFVSAAGVATSLTPGLLQWEVPALAASEALSWTVDFEVTNVCLPDGLWNRTIADAEGPEGQPAHDETLVAFEAEPMAPDLSVTKRLVEPKRILELGSVLQYEILVRNTGNTALAILASDDNWDPDCLEFVGAVPAPDGINASGGLAYWDNVGPLGPGDASALSIFLRVAETCQATWNCSRAFWLVDDTPEMDAVDCMDIHIGPPRHPIYLPLVLKGSSVPGPAATPGSL